MKKEKKKKKKKSKRKKKKKKKETSKETLHKCASTRIREPNFSQRHSPTYQPTNTYRAQMTSFEIDKRTKYKKKSK
jgi:hypothetical protein